MAKGRAVYDRKSRWRPRLARGVRLHHDAVRGLDVLLAPEHVVTLNPSAAAILRRCDGDQPVEQMLVGLAAEFEGADDINGAVVQFLDRMHESGWVW
jgi:pyrroloquinoline quinone biosynthesis protein D